MGEIGEELDVEVAPDGTLDVGFEIEAGDDAEIATTATESPEEIGVGFLVDLRDGPVG